MEKRLSRPVWAWALYDWGNSAFATTVMAAFFPIYFKKFWSQGIDPTVSTFYLGASMSIMALVLAAAAPLLGTFADFYGWKRKGVGVFAILGAISTIGFYWVPSGQWLVALIVYGFASFGFVCGNLFYDSLLVDVAKKANYGFVSGLGYALGYLGGGLLVAMHALMVTKPQLFGLENSSEAVQWAFVTVGIWWFLFTLPLLFLVKEKEPPKPAPHWTEGFRQLKGTLHEIFTHKNLLLFLVAYFFYIDGVSTIYKMAVDFAMAIHLKSDDLIKGIIVVQFVGFPATLAFASLSKKIGAKVGIFIGIVVYSAICILASQMQTSLHFYLLAITLGCVQGGVQALSRSLYGNLIPQDQATKYFGFYNMFGKFSAVLGPFLVGVTAYYSGSPRTSLAIIVILFVAGGFFLSKVQEPHDGPIRTSD